MQRIKMATAADARRRHGVRPAAGPGPGLPTFSESVEVRVLNLDVDVTDSKGNPVTDLKREDFTLKIGGKPVPIDYFSPVSDGTIHAPDLATAPPEQVLDDLQEGRGSLRPAQLPGLRGSRLPGARPAQPQPRTRSAIWPRASARTTPSASSCSTGLPSVLVDWTTSKEVVLTALTDIERQGVGMSRLQTQTQTIEQIDGMGGGRRNVSCRLQLARQYGSEVGMEIETMISTACSRSSSR